MSVTWYCSAILGAINALVDTSLFPEVNFAGKSDLYWKVIELFFIPSDLSIFPTALIASARKSPDITSCTSVCVVVTFHIFKVPAVSYPDAESGCMSIEGDNKKELLRMISEAKKASKGSEPIVYFTTPEHSQETYVGVFSSGTNHDDETNMVGKPLKIWNRTSTHTDVQDVISGDFLAEAIRAVGKMDKSLGIKNSSITLRYKSDFPAKLSSGNKEVSTNALIAPRIAEQYQVSDMKKMIMDEISKNN